MNAYWQLVTDADQAELEAVGDDLANPGVNPMTVKKRLAHRIVRMYHGAEAAERARSGFDEQFVRRRVPTDLPVWSPEAGVHEMGIKDLLVKAGLARSGSEAWRKVDEGAVAIDQVRITDRGHRHSLTSAFVLQLGRRMIRVVPRA